MVHRKLHAKKPGVVALLGLSDVLFFCLVNPQSSSSFVIISGCLLFAATIYTVILVFTKSLAFSFEVFERSYKRSAAFMSLLLIYLVLMQSIGQLGLRDVIAAVLVAGLLYAYLSYTSNRTNTQSSH